MIIGMAFKSISESKTKLLSIVLPSIVLSSVNTLHFFKSLFQIKNIET